MKRIFIGLVLVGVSALAADKKPDVIPTIRLEPLQWLWLDPLVDGRFQAQGTWTTTDLSDESQLVGYPINITEIVCRRESKIDVWERGKVIALMAERRHRLGSAEMAGSSAVSGNLIRLVVSTLCHVKSG